MPTLAQSNRGRIQGQGTPLPVKGPMDDAGSPDFIAWKRHWRSMVDDWKKKHRPTVDYSDATGTEVKDMPDWYWIKMNIVALGVHDKNYNACGVPDAWRCYAAMAPPHPEDPLENDNFWTTNLKASFRMSEVQRAIIAWDWVCLRQGPCEKRLGWVTETV